MSLVPFLVVATVMTAASLFARGRPGLAGGLALIGLIASLATALTIRPDERLVLGGSELVTSDFLRLFLVLCCACAIGLALLGAAAGTRRDAPAVMLGTLAAAGLALALVDPRVAVPAATIGGLIGVLVTIVPSGARVGATIGIREIRAVIIAGALAIVAAAWIAQPLGDPAILPEVFGIAYLGFTIAVAIRFGVIPFHFWAARLADAAPEVTLPVLTAWGPAALAVVALAWIDRSVADVVPTLGAERAILVGIGLLTVLLATFAAWIQEDLEHVLGYSIMGDAGVVVLGLAVVGPEAWEPVRVWILAFIVSRSAFAAWCAATRTTFWTGRLDDLRGWARHSPPLVLTLGLVIMASVGLPGFAAWEARSTIVDLLFGSPWATVVLVALLAPLAYYARLLAIGLQRPHGGAAAEDWRPSWPAVDLNRARTSVTEVARVNRGPATTVLALLLAVLAVGTSAGAFGVQEAAAGRVPAPDDATTGSISQP